MTIDAQHTRTNLALYPLSVAKSHVCLLLQSGYLRSLSDCLIQDIHLHHSGQFTTYALAQSDLFRRLIRIHNSRTPFKTHNSDCRLRSTGSIASVQARNCWGDSRASSRPEHWR